MNNYHKKLFLKRAMTAQLKVHIPSRSHDPCRDFQQLQAQSIHMTILNEDREVLQDDRIISNELLNISLFSEAPSLYPDLFLITYTDRIINLKNISDRSLDHIYVYYKNVDEYGFFGGITYRSAFGKVDAGKIMQIGAENVHKDSSAVIFVTYVE